ncbi:hypothetical protein JXL21_12205 [Candidatus Bathyarchaeota archaeon]|nr:hypothetical protein [Candidatus Bathyarchaeota archaeon]
MRRIFKALIVLIAVIGLAAVSFRLVSQNTAILITPEVWSQNSPDGASYEFKVNDFQCTSDSGLEEGFLWEIDRVVVTDPSGNQYELEKDFNVNDYSGEVTRRFVLYGPAGAGQPESGRYRFDFIKDGETALTKHCDYEQSRMSYPTEVQWTRRGADLHVEWTPPEGAGKDNWYKVLVWSIDDTPNLFISQKYGGESSDAVMEDVPLLEDGAYTLNVAIYFSTGYAYSEMHDFTWDDHASPR